MATSVFNRGDRGLGAMGIVGLLLPAVLAAGGGFVLQRALADDGPSGVELAANRYAAPVYDCPEDPTVADVHNGDRVFAIGVHEDLDGWLLIRNPIDPTVQWWIEDRYVTTDESTGELPELGCDDPVPAPDGTEVAAPVESSTTSGEPDEDDEDDDETEESTTTTTRRGQVPSTSGTNNTTPTTNPPSTPTTTRPRSSTTSPPTTKPKSTTTAPPDTTAPSISNLSRQNAQIRESSGEFCDFGNPTSTTVSASVSDAGGLKSVTLRWSFDGHIGSTPMSFGNGTWTAALGPFSSVNVASGSYLNTNWSVRAVDSAGNVATLNSNSNSAVDVQGC